MKFLIALLISAAFAGSLEGVLKNNEGVKKFKEEKPVEAYDRFTGALAELPFDGGVHFNLGTSFLVNKEYEKALSEYREAIRLSPGQDKRSRETRFAALFNSAVTLTEMKKTDEALELYQQALEIHPDSVETKTNIELLVQQQQQGQGEGEGDQQKQDQQQGQGKDQKEQPQPQQQQGEKPKPSPKPFNSEELSKQDVQRILEELKRQEEQIRARIQNEGAKDAPPEKDW